MTDRIEIYLENESVLIPAGQEIKPPAHIRQLIYDYVLLYVDTADPEVVSYIPGKTSMRRGGNRVENLTFRYQSNSSAGLITKFGRLIESLHNPEDGTEEQIRHKNGDELSNQFPRSIEESGIFEQWWEFSNPDFDFLAGRDELHPIILKNISGEIPNLEELVRRAFLKQIAEGDTQLRLKIDNFEAAAKVIKYVAEQGYETSIAVYRNGDQQSLSEPEVILVPGYPTANFDAVDEATRSALQQSVQEVKENWQEELTKGGIETIHALVDTNSVERYTILKDLKSIYQYFDADRERRIRSDLGQQVIFYYEETIETDSHLTTEEKAEVLDNLLEKLQTEFDSLRGEVVTEQSKKLQKSIDRVNAQNPKEKFDTFRRIEKILETDRSREINPKDYSGSVRSIAVSWQQLVAPQGPGEDIVDEIRTQVMEHLDEPLQEQREKVVDKLIQDFEQKITKIQVDYNLRDSERLHVLKLSKNSIENELVPKELDNYDNNNRVNDIKKRLEELSTEEGIDTKTANQVRDRLSRKFSSEIEDLKVDVQNEYWKQIRSTVGGISNSEVTPAEKAERFEAIKKLLRSSSPSSQSMEFRSTEVQNVQSTLETLEDDPALDEASKQKVCKQALDYVEQLEQEVEKQLHAKSPEGYLQEFSNVLEELERELQHAPKKMDNLLNEIQDIVTSNKELYLKREYHTSHQEKFIRKASTVLYDHFKDNKIKSRQREKLLQRIETARPNILVEPDSEGKSAKILKKIPFPLSRRVGTAIAVLILLALIAISAGVILDGNPFGSNSTGQADLEVTSPAVMSIDDDTIVVRGSTSAEWVEVQFDHTYRKGVQVFDIEVDESGSFEREFDDIPVGTYVLTISTNSTTQNNTQTRREFTYLGDLGDPISISDPKPEEIVESREVEISLESSVDQLEVKLYSSNGEQHLSERVTEIEDRRIFTVDVHQPGTYILEVSVPGLQGEYTERRVFSVETPIIEINSIETNEPVTAGQQLEISVNVANRGNTAQSVNLTLMSDIFTGTKQIQLGPGAEEPTQFTFETTQNDSGTHIVTIETDETRIEKRVTIESEENRGNEGTTLEIENVESKDRPAFKRMKGAEFPVLRPS